MVVKTLNWAHPHFIDKYLIFQNAEINKLAYSNIISIKDAKLEILIIRLIQIIFVSYYRQNSFKKYHALARQIKMILDIKNSLSFFIWQVTLTNYQTFKLNYTFLTCFGHPFSHFLKALQSLSIMWLDIQMQWHGYYQTLTWVIMIFFFCRHQH